MTPFPAAAGWLFAAVLVLLLVFVVIIDWLQDR